MNMYMYKTERGEKESPYTEIHHKTAKNQSQRENLEGGQR